MRKRNLGPILDANGWAVNAQAKMNVPLGASLTQIAILPAGSQRDLYDPFADKKSPWPKVILAAVVLLGIAYGAWYFGALDNSLPAKLQTTSVFGTNAWSYVPPPAK